MVLDSLRQRVDEVTGQANNNQPEGRYAELDEASFVNTFGGDLQADTWRDLAEFVVDAQNAYNVGYGAASVPSKVGRWYMVLMDGNGSEVVGHARIKTRNSNDEQVETEIRSVHTRRLNTDPNNYRNQFAVPEVEETDTVGEDSKVVLQFKLASSSAGTSVDFSADATTLAFPLTNFS